MAAHPACGRKTTDHVNFGKAVEGIPSGTYAYRLLHEITRRRQALEDVIKYPDTSTTTVLNTLHEYLVMPIRNVLSEARRPFKLRFKWRSFIDPEEDASSSQDSDVDQVAFLVAVALWLMDHAHMVHPLYRKSDEIDENKMKDALNSLKFAAGICECVQQRPKSDFLDLTVPVNQALGIQCLAEAQMVTINRAVTKGNKASLISQLANDVAKKCISASSILQKCGKPVEKWRLYLLFKGELYFAVARCFQGVSLLEEKERSGMSVAVLAIALKHIAACVHLAKEYAKLKPKAKQALTELSDFVWAQKLVALKAEKSNRENSMVYHQRIPEEADPMDEPKCLVTSNPFNFPPPDLSGLKDGETDGSKSVTSYSAGTGNEKLLHKADEVEDDDETLWGCACQRWLFLSIFMPVILIISLFGFFFWIILLPFHRFCAVGKTFAKVFNGVERLVKLPLLSVQWAVGKRQPRDVEFDELQEQESRRNYGGTDDVSMNEIGKTQK